MTYYIPFYPYPYPQKFLFHGMNKSPAMKIPRRPTRLAFA